LPRFTTLKVTTDPFGTLVFESRNLKSTAVTLIVTVASRKPAPWTLRAPSAQERRRPPLRHQRELQFASLRPSSELTTDQLVPGGEAALGRFVKGTYDGIAKA
jgi:hypothetical protein